jgi:hypothetical protein
MQPCGTHRHASAWCLHSAGLGRDGPHAVLARNEEAEALHETSLLSSWRGHLDREVMAQQNSGKATT